MTFSMRFFSFDSACEIVDNMQVIQMQMARDKFTASHPPKERIVLNNTTKVARV